jgi:hypothetical protein
MTREEPCRAPALGCTWRATISLAPYGRTPSAPVPGKDRSAASHIDEGYHYPKEPQFGLPGNPVGVIADVDGECGERNANGDCAQRQAADQACCQAMSPRGHDRINVVPSGPASSCQPGVNACAYFVVDLREKGLHHRVAVLRPQLSMDFGSGADVVWRQRRGTHGWRVAVEAATVSWPRRRKAEADPTQYDRTRGLRDRLGHARSRPSLSDLSGWAASLCLRVVCACPGRCVGVAARVAALGERTLDLGHSARARSGEMPWSQRSGSGSSRLHRRSVGKIALRSVSP